MPQSQQEASERVSATVEHVFTNLLAEIRSDRVAAGLPSHSDFVCLVQGHGTRVDAAAEFIESFNAGGELRIPLGSPLSLARDRQTLSELLLPLYVRGEHDSSFVDFSRADATLLHIHNVHCKTKG